jgi:hypothetical protein
MLVLVITTKMLIGIPVAKCILLFSIDPFWFPYETKQMPIANLMSPLFSIPLEANTTKTVPLILSQLLLSYLNMMKFPSPIS